MKPKFKKTQRFRMIINGIGFWTNANSLRMGFGSTSSANMAAMHTLDVLERDRQMSQDAAKKIMPQGIAMRVGDYDVQLDVIL